MSDAFDKELIGLDDANKVLDEMEAADRQAAGEQGNQDNNDQDQGASGTQDSDAGKDAGQGQQADDANQAKTDAGKTDDQGKAAEAATDQGKADAGKTGSRYEQARSRLEGGWKELNTGKATLQTERDAWKKQQEAERLALETERAEFEQQRSQAESQFTPEAFDKAAARFEREGKLDLADAARERAAELRKNPPQKPADRLAAQRKDWALKAGQEFPELAKQNSPFQVRVAQLLKAEPDLERHPKGLYLAARIANLEGKANEAAAVQAKFDAQTKALSEAQAQIKELQELVAPGDGTNNNHLPRGKSFEQMSDSEQFAELERQAQQVGVLTR